MEYFPKLIFDKYILFYTGKIYSLIQKKFLKPAIRGKTYPYYFVSLSVAKNIRKSFYVHRLIALNFIKNDNPDLNIVVDHLNRNKKDNRIINLEWTTHKKNLLNRKKKGYSKFFDTSYNKFVVKWKISDEFKKYKKKTFVEEIQADKFIEDNYPFPTTIEN